MCPASLVAQLLGQSVPVGSDQSLLQSSWACPHGRLLQSSPAQSCTSPSLNPSLAELLTPGSVLPLPCDLPSARCCRMIPHLPVPSSGLNKLNFSPILSSRTRKSSLEPSSVPAAGWINPVWMEMGKRNLSVAPAPPVGDSLSREG